MRARRWILIPGIVALATLPVGHAATLGRTLGPTGSQGNQALFQDPAGDALASADIATVVVSNDDAGFLSFQVVFVGKPARDISVLVYLDTDKNAATGAPNLFGADYAVVVWDMSAAGSSFSLRRWNGKTFKEFFSQPPDVAVKGGVLTFAFATSDLGKVSDIKFALATERQAARTLDRAPDVGKPPWSFHIKTAPVRLSAVGLETTPKPRAGHALVATMTLRPSVPVADLGSRLDGPVCAARVGSTLLVERSASLNEFAGSPKVAAKCVWRIPPGTSGKLFQGSVKVTFLGKALTRRFSARITD